jgi:hypothetical protein
VLRRLPNGVRARDCAATRDLGRVARAEAPPCLASASGSAASASGGSWPSTLPGEQDSSYLPETGGLPGEQGSSYLPETIGLPSQRGSSYGGRRQLGRRIGRLSGHCNGSGSVAVAGGYCCGSGCGWAEVRAACLCRRPYLAPGQRADSLQRACGGHQRAAPALDRARYRGRRPAGERAGQI